MSRIRGKNTGPEIFVRQILHRNGYRFRVHDKRLPGKPDIVLKRNRTIILVHGCFWHHHSACKRATIPRTNRQFWIKKIAGNVERDTHLRRQLSRLGWRVITLWQCELRDVNRVERRLLRALKSAPRQDSANGPGDVLKDAVPGPGRTTEAAPRL
ncbi:MAG: DNA mismatch endonuclease Vsr [Verrucomicrobia bacterium]|nr:DNA mismatch endonuclease Vsr [Verrucomicrobiota bacterium]